MSIIDWFFSVISNARSTPESGDESSKNNLVFYHEAGKEGAKRAEAKENLMEQDDNRDWAGRQTMQTNAAIGMAKALELSNTEAIAVDRENLDNTHAQERKDGADRAALVSEHGTLGNCHADEQARADLVVTQDNILPTASAAVAPELYSGEGQGDDFQQWMQAAQAVRAAAEMNQQGSVLQAQPATRGHSLSN